MATRTKKAQTIEAEGAIYLLEPFLRRLHAFTDQYEDSGRPILEHVRIQVKPRRMFGMAADGYIAALADCEIDKPTNAVKRPPFLIHRAHVKAMVTLLQKERTAQMATLSCDTSTGTVTLNIGGIAHEYPPMLPGDSTYPNLKGVIDGIVQNEVEHKYADDEHRFVALNAGLMVRVMKAMEPRKSSDNEGGVVRWYIGTPSVPAVFTLNTHGKARFSAVVMPMFVAADPPIDVMEQLAELAGA